MGFNAGAFAGALGTSALNTFTRLEENSRAAQKAQQDAEQFEAWRKEQQQQADLAANYGNTIGSADTTQRTAVPGTMGVGPDGPVAQMQDAPYTDAQKLADFKSKNSAAGIDPLKTLQISSASRADKSAQKLADFQDWTISSQELLQKDPVEWARQNLDAYNKPRKGGPLDDGMTAEIVKGADGSSSFIQKNAKGAVVSSTPITPETANDAFQRIAFAKYQALDFKGGMELGIKKDRATYENMRDAAASNYYNGVGRQAGGGSKGSVKNFTVETVDDKGVKVKTPVLARVGTDKEGNPKVEAFTLDGKPITDSKIINQLGAPSGDENGPSSALGADVASARKRYETGAIDYKTYQQEVGDILRTNGATATDKALPKPGGSFFGDKTKAIKSAEAPAQQPLSDGIGVHKTRGGTYFTVPGVATPFKTQAEAEAAFAEVNKPKAGLNIKLSPEIINSAVGY